jgi:hypothetical protein
MLYYVAVCMTVVEKFANTLTPDVKLDTKKIEAEFRKFCRTSQSKENRFVSIRCSVIRGMWYYYGIKVIFCAILYVFTAL